MRAQNMQNLISSSPKIHHTILKDEIGAISTIKNLTECEQTLSWQAGAFNIYKNIALLISYKGARKIIEPMQYDDPKTKKIHSLINETPYQLFIRCQDYLKNRELNLALANNEQYPPQETSAQLVLLFKNQEDCWLIDATQIEQLWAENCQTHIVVCFNFHERHEQKIVLPISDWTIIEKLMRNILLFREKTHQRWEISAQSTSFICLQKF